MSTPQSKASTTAAPAPPHFTELIPSNPGIDFVGMRFKMLIVSWTLIIAGFASIYLHGGLNYGIDFAGGTMIHIRLPANTSAADVRAALERPEFKSVTVQDIQGGSQAGREYQIRVQAQNEAETAGVADIIRSSLKEKFGEGSYDVLRVETVGPQVGKDLWRDASIAVLVATLAMGLYIAFRFEARFGLGAAIALVHDVLITLGALSLAQMEFDLSTVAALLTVVGFSVNDTVIVSDRIRENMRMMTRERLETVMNLSINQTLSRTILTSGTAIMTATALFILGGPVIRSFSFAILVGFTIGTYSSIFVASPVVLYFEHVGKRKGR